MRFLILTIILALTACNQQEQGPVDSEVSPTSGLDDEQTLPGERSLADETLTGPTRAAADLDHIPQPFHGVWDSPDGSCDPASDLRVEIGARSITFYESIGSVERVTANASDAVTVALDMQGEGETWKDTLILTLSNEGETLTPRNADLSAQAALTLARCPI
ncbi:MAG: hypothetical protein WA918_05705 [Erythrobacter sp.]